MRSKTEPRARPSCRLKVAENPMMGIVCGSFGRLKVASGFCILESKFDNRRRYLMCKIKINEILTYIEPDHTMEQQRGELRQL